MNLFKSIIKKALGTLIIASWILLIWKKQGKEDATTFYLLSLGILYAMVYAPWLYACFNPKGKFSLLPPLPKTYQNILWNVNVIASLLPAILGLMILFSPANECKNEDYSIVFVAIFFLGGLVYWYISYIIYLLIQGFSHPKWRKVCLCIGLLMILLPIAFLIWSLNYQQVT